MNNIGRSWLIVILFLYVAPLLATTPASYTGKKHAMLSMLLSENDLNVKVAAKTIFYDEGDDQEIIDILAEKTWFTCAEKNDFTPDTVAWMGKALGNSKQAKYASVLDFCLANISSSKIKRHFENARENYDEKNLSSFERGKVDLAKLQSQLTQGIRNPSLKKHGKIFDELKAGEKLDDVYRRLGKPEEVSTETIIAGSVGTGFGRVRVAEDLIVFNYEELGSVRFTRNKETKVWHLKDASSNNGLHWATTRGMFVTHEIMLATSNGLELRIYAKELLKNDNVDVSILDYAANRLYYSKDEEDDYTVAGFGYLIKLMNKYKGERYQQIFSELGESASHSKLRKWGGRYASKYQDTKAEQFKPFNKNI